MGLSLFAYVDLLFRIYPVSFNHPKIFGDRSDFIEPFAPFFFGAFTRGCNCCLNDFFCQFPEIA